jgi:hypothetical protein
MDQDQNRQISRQEHMQYGEQQFNHAQEQAGGQLTTAAPTGEAQTGQTPGWQQAARWREAAVDRNGDGIVSSDEAASAWIDSFDQLDHDGDDQLSQDELDQMQAHHAMVDQRFGRLDANGDGQISPDEYASAGHDVMQSADLNGDGQVSPWEYRAARVADH